MSKTPATPDIAGDGSAPDPTADLPYQDDPTSDLVYPAPPDDPIESVYWRATSFASALLANPRVDYLLRLKSHLEPASIGSDLADACWQMATAFNHRLGQLKQAAQNNTQEQAQ